MITTVCLNPSFDKTAYVDTLKIGDINALKDARVDMGGKGINVAVAARRLGIETQCLGIMGENGSARMHEMLEQEKVQAHFLIIKGAVRVNLKVVSKDAFKVTEFNEPGETVSPEDFSLFCQMAAEKSKGSDGVVLTGSLPPGCAADTYKQLMIKTKEMPCVLDTLGESLLLVLPFRPFLIKPNLTELETTLGRKLSTFDDILKGAQVLVDKGAQNVIVSMGQNGALMTDGPHSFFAPAPKVTARSTVGAGDAMVGGVLYGLKRFNDMREAFKCGVAAGAASVMTEGTQLLHTEDFAKLLPMIQMRSL